MSDQFSMFEPMTSEATPSAISSPGSESGPTHSETPDGPTTAKSGRAPAPASPSAPPAKAKRSTTKGIFGQSGFHSSKHEDLSFALANRLRPLTDSLGSTLFNLTWMTRITPAGRSISALRASEPLTEGSVFIGWPTPQKHDERERGNTMADHHYFPHDLSNAATMAAWPTPAARDFRSGMENRATGDKLGLHAVGLNDWALLAGWPTTRAEDAESSGMRHSRGVADTMTAVASLASWATPKPRDFKTESQAVCSQERMAEHAPDLSKQAILAGWPTPNTMGGGQTSRGGDRIDEKLMGGLAQLAAWPTPMAGTPAQKGYNEAGNSDYSRKVVEAVQWPVDPSMDSGETPIGFLLGPNGWEIVPACGQLSAAHSRWLMGLPSVWDACGVTAMALLARSRKRS